MSVIGTRIRELRKENKMTQEELGNKLGLVKSTISLYESGGSYPDDVVKGKICDIFGVSMDYLVGRSDDRNKKKVALLYDSIDSKEIIEAVLARNPRLARICKLVDEMNEEEYETFEKVVRLIQK